MKYFGRIFWLIEVIDFLVNCDSKTYRTSRNGRDRNFEITLHKKKRPYAFGVFTGTWTIHSKISRTISPTAMPVVSAALS
jgi:hypothetical protein